MKYSSKEKKIIEMCASYENRENPSENDKAYYVKLWSNKVEYESYNGSDGLKTIIDAYCDKLNEDIAENDITDNRKYYDKYIGKGVAKAKKWI